MRQLAVAIVVFLCFFGGVRFFYRSSSALHRRSSTEILSRPLGHLLCRGVPQCLIFSFLAVAGFEPMRTCYRCATLTPQKPCMKWVPHTGGGGGGDLPQVLVPTVKWTRKRWR